MTMNLQIQRLLSEEIDHKNISNDYPNTEIIWLNENNVIHELESWSNPFDDVYFTLSIMFANEAQKAEYCINFE